MHLKKVTEAWLRRRDHALHTYEIICPKCKRLATVRYNNEHNIAYRHPRTRTTPLTYCTIEKLNGQS